MSVTRAGDNRVDLWWDPVSNADMYSVYSATAAGGPYTQLGTSVVPSFSHLGAANGAHYYYKVSAYRNGAEGAISPEVEAVPHAPGPLAALPANGLALVLSASELAYTHDNGESVTNWPTALGGSAVASGPEGSKPTFVTAGINGQPAVRFDGVNDYLNLSGAFSDFTQGASMYVVAKPATLSTGFKYLMLGNGASSDGIGLGRDGSTAGLQYFTFSGWGGVGWFNTASGLVAGQTSLISLIQDAGSANSMSFAQIAKNGAPIYGNNVYVPSVSARTLNYIGKSYWADGLFQGDIAEVIVYNRKLSSTEQATVRSYVAVKYGLAMDGNPGVPQPIEAPLSLTAVGGNNSVALAWAPVTGAAGYRVYRTGPSQPQTQIATVTTASHNDTTVANGFSYQYTVTAYNSSSESLHSASVTVIPIAPVQLPVGVPTNGLVLGLDAATALLDYGNNQAVGVWRDSSTSHQHAMTAGASPLVVANALNGKPVVRFDGIDDYLTLPSGFQNFSAGMTAYIVARPSSLPSGFKLLLLGNGSGADDNCARSRRIVRGTSVLYLLGQWSRELVRHALRTRRGPGIPIVGDSAKQRPGWAQLR